MTTKNETVINIFKDKIENNSPDILGWFLMASYSKYRLGKDLMKEEELEFLSNKLKKNWDNISSPFKKYITLNYLTTPIDFDIEYPSKIKLFTVNFGENIKNFLDQTREGFGKNEEERIENMDKVADDAFEILKFFQFALSHAAKRKNESR